MITEIYSLSKALKTSWKFTLKNWVVFVGLSLGLAIICLIFSLFTNGNHSLTTNIISNILLTIISIVYSMGISKMYLDLTIDKEITFSLFWKTIPKIIPFFLLSLMLTILIVIGLVLLIVPGLWVMARLGFAPFILLDEENCTISKALKESYTISQNHTISLIGMYLMIFVIYLVGIICFIVGAFFASVWCYFLVTVSMRMLQYERLQKESETTELKNEDVTIEEIITE